MLKQLFYLLTLTCFSLPVSSQAETLTFSRIATEILEKNANIESAKVTVDQQKMKEKSAKWDLAPKLSLSSYKSYQGENANNSSSTVSANINLFKGLSSWNKIQYASHATEKGVSDLQSIRLDILSQIASYYLAWQRSQMKLEIVSQLTEMRKKVQTSIQNSVQAGVRSNIDRILFDNLLLQANERLIRMKIELDRSYIAIQNLLSEHESRHFNLLIPQPSKIFTKSFCNIKADFETYPQVKSLTNSLQIYAEQKDISGASYFPSVDFSANKELGAKPSTGGSDDYSLLLSLNWQIFTGFSTFYDQADTSFEMQKVEIEKEATKTRLQLAHQENCDQLSLTEDLEVQNKLITENFKALVETSRVQYQNGGISALDLTDQELRFLDAKLNLIDAQFSKQEILASQWILHSGSLDELGAQ